MITIDGVSGRAHNPKEISERLLMSSRSADDVSKIIINPFYAITIADGLFGDHPSLIARSDWLKANVRLIDEIGVEEWLEQLLEVLEGGYVRNPEEES